MDAGAWQIVAFKRLRGGFQACKPFSQAVQSAGVVAGADFARVFHLAALIVADQQRAEANTLALRIGVAADHKLLLVDAFEFEPLARSLGYVRAIAILGYNAFPSPLARFPEIRVAFRLAVFGKAQRLLE